MRQKDITSSDEKLVLVGPVLSPDPLTGRKKPKANLSSSFYFSKENFNIAFARKTNR
jgi:hypothetical protein